MGTRSMQASNGTLGRFTRWISCGSTRTRANQNGVSTFKRFGRAGVATLRGNWSAIKTTYLGIKGDANNACEHGHYDLSSFVLDSSGLRWIMDLGPEDYDPPDYFDANMRACYHRASTIGHNTLTETAQRAT